MPFSLSECYVSMIALGFKPKMKSNLTFSMEYVMPLIQLKMRQTNDVCSKDFDYSIFELIINCFSAIPDLYSYFYFIHFLIGYSLK
jgi:hypothetical protein